MFGLYFSIIINIYYNSVFKVTHVALTLITKVNIIFNTLHTINDGLLFFREYH